MSWKQFFLNSFKIFWTYVITQIDTWYYFLGVLNTELGFLDYRDRWVWSLNIGFRLLAISWKIQQNKFLRIPDPLMHAWSARRSCVTTCLVRTAIITFLLFLFTFWSFYNNTYLLLERGIPPPCHWLETVIDQY